jgi:thiamine biosynthesis lipoprotein
MRQAGHSKRERFSTRPHAVVPLLCAALICSCTPDGGKQEDRPEPEPAPTQPATWSSQQRELYFGIPVQVRFQPADADLERKAWAYLEHVDDVFNDYREDSEVGRLNAALARGQEAQVSEELADALRFAAQAHVETDGAFDVTIGPLRDLWQRAAREEKWPAGAAIQRTRALCGLDKVSLTGRTVKTKVRGMRFDFGGCIKGWAVDRVMAILRKGGARAALVQVGGETAAFGHSPRGRTHVLGIQHPIEMDRIWVALTDPGSGLSAATSGNYRAPLVMGDRLLYHIFDPRTGRPADPRVLSASVVFRSTGRNVWADALSTAGTVLPIDRFLALVKRLGGEALVIERRGPVPGSGPGVAANRGEPVATREHTTPGWTHLIVRE